MAPELEKKASEKEKGKIQGKRRSSARVCRPSHRSSRTSTRGTHSDRLAEEGPKGNERPGSNFGPTRGGLAPQEIRCHL